MKYVALLRGVNVGGKNSLKMADLKIALESDGFADVRTYINSGNVIFSYNDTGTEKLAKKIEQVIARHFDMDVPTVVVSQDQLAKIVADTPVGWGKDSEWKYNILFLLPPYDMNEIIDSIGELKPDIETLVPRDGYLYQSMSITLFGRTTTGKLAATKYYKRMTIRNWNTTKKLHELIKADT